MTYSYTSQIYGWCWVPLGKICFSHPTASLWVPDFYVTAGKFSCPCLYPSDTKPVDIRTTDIHYPVLHLCIFKANCFKNKYKKEIKSPIKYLRCSLGNNQPIVGSQKNPSGFRNPAISGEKKRKDSSFFVQGSLFNLITDKCQVDLSITILYFCLFSFTSCLKYCNMHSPALHYFLLKIFLPSFFSSTVHWHVQSWYFEVRLKRRKFSCSCIFPMKLN